MKMKHAAVFVPPNLFLTRLNSKLRIASLRSRLREKVIVGMFMFNSPLACHESIFLAFDLLCCDEEIVIYASQFLRYSTSSAAA
jgi:hypothetical protein